MKMSTKFLPREFTNCCHLHSYVVVWTQKMHFTNCTTWRKNWMDLNQTYHRAVLPHQGKTYPWPVTHKHFLQLQHLPHLHFRLLNHISLLLPPTDSQLRRVKPSTVVWIEETTAALWVTVVHRLANVKRCCSSGWQHQSWGIYIFRRIICEQMCWWCGDYKGNKINFQDNILARLNPHKYAFRIKRSREYDISTARHSVFTQLKINNSWIRMLVYEEHRSSLTWYKKTFWVNFYSGVIETSSWETAMVHGPGQGSSRVGDWNSSEYHWYSSTKHQ